MRIDYDALSERVAAGAQVMCIGNVIFEGIPFKDHEGILIRHDSDIDLPATFDGWESIEPYVPRLKPVHIGAMAIQFFHDRNVRLIDPFDLKYLVNGHWKTFHEVMAL